ncbi:Canalicular multispecific organic anion transporter 1 [Colletotrichum higginsianum]|uniref:Canalicular multispecific organic anion transporter 1 n=1 Tax=Colletotrichum higginsianum TaxID=80884 RepID=A0A4T0VTF2_9PEZI|nr:Canalicular multispecific organic anion transporter 1 [Colletotrichum higginsianum]
MDGSENFEADSLPRGGLSFYSYVALQDVLGGPHLPPPSSHAASENATLTTLARFNASKIMDITNIVRASIAASLLCLLFVRPLLRKRPAWCRGFAQESLYSEVVRPSLKKPWTFWTVYLFAVALAGLIEAILSVVAPPRRHLYLLDLVPWIAAVLITAVDRPTKTPKTLLFLYVVILACGVVSTAFSYRLHRLVPTLILADPVVGLAGIVGIVAMPMRDPSLTDSDIAREEPTDELRSPEDNLSLWRFMTVSWMAPMIARGYEKQLHNEDVWQLPFDFQHERLHSLFRDLRGSMTTKLFSANGLDLIIQSLLGLIECAAALSVPMLLQQLLRAIQSGPNNIEVSVLYAIAILAVRLLACQAAVFQLWFSRRCYERSRGEMITTIYAKTLSRKHFGQPAGEKVSDTDNEEDDDDDDDEDGEGADANAAGTTDNDERIGRVSRFLGWLRRDNSTRPKYQRLRKPKAQRQPATTGKILNLMRNDVYEVAQRFWEFPSLVTKPLQFIFSFILVWQLLGYSCMFGMACVMLAQMLNTIFITQLLKNERVRRAATDARLQSTSQFVEGIRHLRWYDWQSKWLDSIMVTRRHELSTRVVTGLWSIAISTLNITSGTLFPVATFFAYTFIAGRTLTVDVAFPALSLFTLLETSFKELPSLITVFLNASIAMGRIEEFMSEPDKEGVYSDHLTNDIKFTKATFAWPGYEQPVLTNLDVGFPQGLTVVFGKVGSGKTALLQAILGELDRQVGDVIIPTEPIGYCAQSPWLQHMSIRDNILFSAPFDPTRYTQTLDACALLPDLANFKHGDLSDMGENGIGLSGGQRARVALARAVYSQSRVLLLDDPLAALDHNTAESIVKKLLQGPLVEGRTVVLVTHRVDLCLHLAGQMVEIADGTARVLNSKEAAAEVAKFLSEDDDTAAHHDEPEHTLEEQQDAAMPSKFIEEEHRAHGGVMLSVYWTYIKAGKLKWWTVLLLVFGLFRLGSLLNYWFLKAWGEAYKHKTSTQEASSGVDFSNLFGGLPDPDTDLRPWLWVYLAIAVAQATIYTLSEGLTLLMIITAARDLFKRVITKVSKATFRFYDVTPVGRLMNRLVSDIGMIDGGIMRPLREVAAQSITWFSSMVVIASVTPLFLVFSVGMTLWFVYIFMRFLPTSQSLRRLEMVSLSPLMSNFGILLDGLATIRAFKAQHHFQNMNIVVTDAFQKMDHFYWSLQAWLMYRFDALSAISTFALTLLALYKGLSPGLTAFVLTTASAFVEATHNLCKQYGTLQMDFVSVERVIELLDIPEEPCGELTPPLNWPHHSDDVTFDNVTLKYAPHLEPSVSEASFTIPGGSTCAVLGRTGSGKSTLALALLATIHPSEGSIRIGSYRLSDVDVHVWRQRVSFVAQDPVLFPGTLRDNLDPLHQYTDTECVVVLHRVLGPGWDLYSRVEGGGKNLSQGQRQLVGIGRAVLRRSPIVVLDEATASIDKETAARVQEVLRNELTTSTVITIAHRLEAVQDANYFIRLDKGMVIEHGPTRGLNR